MLLGTLAADLLENILTRWGIYRAGKNKGVIATRQGRGKEINGAAEGVSRAGYGNNMDF